MIPVSRHPLLLIRSLQAASFLFYIARFLLVTARLWPLKSCFLSLVVPLRCLSFFTRVALFATRFLYLPAPFLLLGSCLCWLADRRSLYSAFSSLVAALYSMLGTGRNQPIFAQWQYAVHDLFSLISACYFHVTSHDSLNLLCCSLSKRFLFFYLPIRV